MAYTVKVGGLTHSRPDLTRRHLSYSHANAHRERLLRAGYADVTLTMGSRTLPLRRSGANIRLVNR